MQRSSFFGIFYDYQEHLSIVKLIEIFPIWKWLLKQNI
ncbi:hypothetical protein BOVA208_4467 [Bacteroides ovatus]|nr:hypothetical protein BOVA208_4467 [Bacteroides ovatus]